MSSIAIYPGTFDPMTNGHLDIVKRAARLFNKIIVAVALTSRKQAYLTWDERINLMTEVLDSFDNVHVLRLEQLLVDFAKRQGASIILRGLRAVSDFDYEFQLAHMNHRLLPAIETVFLPATEGCGYISGTLIREIVESGGDVSAFVPALVAQHLQNKKNS